MVACDATRALESWIKLHPMPAPTLLGATTRRLAMSQSLGHVFCPPSPEIRRVNDGEWYTHTVLRHFYLVNEDWYWMTAERERLPDVAVVAEAVVIVAAASTTAAAATAGRRRNAAGIRHPA